MNILGFVNCKTSVTTIQCCSYNAEEAIENTLKSGHGSVPIKLYLWALKLENHIIFVSKNIFFKDLILVLAALGLRCCVRGLSLVAVSGG